MTYSMVTMRKELQELGFASDNRGFVWEAEAGRVHDGLRQQFAIEYEKDSFLHARGSNQLNDLLEYCWLVYSKALSSEGPQLIGRTGDLWVTEQLQRSGLEKDDLSVLWNTGTSGNIQKMDKWAPVVNDCWVLGGVHRHADFELVSVRTLQNLWDFHLGFHIVTAREILGLLHFGYSLRPQATPVRLVCTDTAKAKAATIGAYTTLMKEKGAAGPDSIRSILEMDPALRGQIEAFDRRRLRHVDPPR